MPFVTSQGALTEARIMDELQNCGLLSVVSAGLWGAGDCCDGRG